MDNDIVWCGNCTVRDGEDGNVIEGREATSHFFTEDGWPFHLCDVCREAFEHGQTYPDSDVHRWIYDSDLEYRYDEAGNEP